MDKFEELSSRYDMLRDEFEHIVFNARDRHGLALMGRGIMWNRKKNRLMIDVIVRSTGEGAMHLYIDEGGQVMYVPPPFSMDDARPLAEVTL